MPVKPSWRMFWSATTSCWATQVISLLTNPHNLTVESISSWVEGHQDSNCHIGQLAQRTFQVQVTPLHMRITIPAIASSSKITPPMNLTDMSVGNSPMHLDRQCVMPGSSSNGHSSKTILISSSYHYASRKTMTKKALHTSSHGIIGWWKWWDVVGWGTNSTCQDIKHWEGGDVRVSIFPIVVCVRSAYVISTGVGFRVDSSAVMLLQLDLWGYPLH